MGHDPPHVNFVGRPAGDSANLRAVWRLGLSAARRRRRRSAAMAECAIACGGDL